VSNTRPSLLIQSLIFHAPQIGRKSSQASRACIKEDAPVTIAPHHEMITGLHEEYKGARRMINLISSTIIERPIQQVFDFISTPENDFHWQYGTLATARLSKGNDAMRNFFRKFGHLMGRRNLGTFEITEFELNKKYGFKSLSGPVHSQTSYTLETESGRTRLHISIQASAPNFFHITEKLLWKTMKTQLEEDVARLKTILEGNSTTSREKPHDIQ
jgi:hypothetical protein